MNSYDKLRSIGASVETADALAPVIDSLSPKKREAFYLWAMGMSQQAIALRFNISRKVVRNAIKFVKDKYKKANCNQKI